MMDGEAGNIPRTWLKGVLEAVERIVGEKKYIYETYSCEQKGKGEE